MSGFRPTALSGKRLNRATYFSFTIVKRFAVRFRLLRPQAKLECPQVQEIKAKKVSQSGAKRYDKSIPTARVLVLAEACRCDGPWPVGDGVQSGPGRGSHQDRRHRGSAGHRRGVDPAGRPDGRR